MILSSKNHEKAKEGRERRETKMENRVMLNYNTHCIQTLPRSGYGFASATRQLSYGWKTLGVHTLVEYISYALFGSSLSLYVASYP